MFFDSNGLPVDITGDGGDSCFRAGILAVTNSKFQINLAIYTGLDGICRRHPSDIPWDNPNNFTRDQLIPLICGLYAQDKKVYLWPIFREHLKRFFFCQNKERDYVGTIKKPYPHYYIDDKGLSRFSWFDSADLLAPWDSLFFLFLLLNRPFILWPIVLSLFTLSTLLRAIFSPDSEDNQAICMALMLGKYGVKMLEILRPNCWRDTYVYWEKRKEPGYYTDLKNRAKEILL